MDFMVPPLVRVFGLALFVVAATAASGRPAVAASRSLTLEQAVPGTIVDVDATRILWYPSLADPVLRIRARGGTTDTVMTGSSAVGFLTTNGAIWPTGEYKSGSFLPTVTARTQLKARGSYATFGTATGLWHRNTDTSTDTLIRSAPLTFPMGLGTNYVATVNNAEIGANGNAVYDVDMCATSCIPSGLRYIAGTLSWDFSRSSGYRTDGTNWANLARDLSGATSMRMNAINFDGATMRAAPSTAQPGRDYQLSGGYMAYTARRSGSVVLEVKTVQTPVSTPVVHGAFTTDSWVDGVADNGEVILFNADGGTTKRWLSVPGQPLDEINRTDMTPRYVGGKWIFIGTDSLYVFTTSTSCTTGADCGSGFCVDGVCCDSACGGGSTTDCLACSVAAGAALNGVCGQRTVGASCNDGNACTSGETCPVAGTCSGGTTTTCSPLDQCHSAGTCDPGTGMCSNPAKTDGTTCSDNNACTSGDACMSGTCVAGSTVVVCTASDQCHDVGTCNPTTGVCSNPAKTNGATCDANDLCRGGPDLCINGSCTATGALNTCPSNDSCRNTGTCDPGTGLCSTGTAKVDDTPCTDQNACTSGDKCQAGVCTPTATTTCTALDGCHDVGVCNVFTGVCSNPAKANGTACSDGNACTTGDACQAGICTPAGNVTCTASDDCHAAGTCDTATGLCSNPSKPDGTACNGSTSCVTGNTCQSGTCAPAGAVSCPAPSQCQVSNVCDTGTGQCAAVNKANGTACDDGNACTTGELCTGGVCGGGTASCPADAMPETGGPTDAAPDQPAPMSDAADMAPGPDVVVDNRPAMDTIDSGPVVDIRPMDVVAMDAVPEPRRDAGDARVDAGGGDEGGSCSCRIDRGPRSTGWAVFVPLGLVLGLRIRRRSRAGRS
jgi:MYXO-CTERM domain-containing protein